MKAKWHGQEEQDKPLTLSSLPCPVLAHQLPKLFSSSIGNRPRYRFPLQGFPIRLSQRLGSCDPRISWLDMAVISDLDLDKRFGSVLQQESCSARDFSLAPVPSPGSATRLGIARSLTRSGLASRQEDVLASVEVDSDKEVPASVEVDSDKDVPASVEVDSDKDVPASVEVDSNKDVPPSVEMARLRMSC